MDIIRECFAVLEIWKYPNAEGRLRVKSISMAKAEVLEVLEKTLQKYSGVYELRCEDDTDSEGA